MRKESEITHLDWLTVILYFLLVAWGILMVYSVDFFTPAHNGIHFKQMMWLGLAFFMLFILHFVKLSIIRDWSSLLYLIGILLLAGLFVFGKKISGAQSWYSFGSISFQPSEIVKLTTALGLAKLMSEYHFDLSRFNNLMKVLLLLGTPVLLILLQPDVGTVITFSAFVVVLFREGLNVRLLLLLFWIILIFILTVYFDAWRVSVSLALLALAISLYLFLKKLKNKAIYIFLTVLFFALSIGLSFSAYFVFNRILLPHQQKRIELLIGKIKDDRGAGYHLKQSLIAISNGNFSGKGFLKGSQMRGRYIPEQHTDYIFTTIAEQFGWVGTMIFIFVYLLFIFRLYYLAERQKNRFARVLGYSLASFLAVHFFLNIMMTTGLFPTVGIPLIYISYGGSSLLAFTIFLFLFLRFDAHRIQEF